MEPNIPGKPLKHFWQFEIGTALESYDFKIPVLFISPVDFIELVLDIE